MDALIHHARIVTGVLEMALKVATQAFQRRDTVLASLLIKEICLRLGALRLFALVNHVLEMHLLRRLFNLNTSNARHARHTRCQVDSTRTDEVIVAFAMALLRCFIDIGARAQV